VISDILQKFDDLRDLSLCLKFLYQNLNINLTRPVEILISSLKKSVQGRICN
jgi:hypothetical protein